MTPFRMEVIANFLSDYQNAPWFSSVREIIWDRRVGADLFHLVLVCGRQRIEILLQNAKYAGQDMAITIDDILKKLSSEGGDHVVDATYEGKILLRKLPGGPKEGSLK